MKKLLLATAMMLAPATAAMAQDEAAAPAKSFTVSGSAAVVTDYRFRGVSQSDENVAVQAGFTVAHESGFYAGTWGSNLAGWGTFGGANLELDLIAGYKMPIGEGGSLDVGVTYYMYPGGFDNTDFFEPYIKLSGTAGPVSLTAGVAYAPKQQALGAWYANAEEAVSGVYSDPNDKNDNLYLWGDASGGIPNTPITLKGHIGYSNGNEGLGPFATSVAPTGEYWDWSAGVDYVIAPVTLNVSYVDTDIGRKESAYIRQFAGVPVFQNYKDGGSIANGTIVASVSVSF